MVNFYWCQDWDSSRLGNSIDVKTSPPSAQVAAMIDMQQKLSKTEKPWNSLKRALKLY